MASLWSRVQQRLLQRDAMDVTKKMDKDTCIAKLRAWKDQLETAASMFKDDEACIFQDAFRLCDEAIRDCESNASVDQHVFANMASICKVIVFKCEAIVRKHEADGTRCDEYQTEARRYHDLSRQYEAEARNCAAQTHKFEAYEAEARRQFEPLILPEPLLLPENWAHAEVSGAVLCLVLEAITKATARYYRDTFETMTRQFEVQADEHEALACQFEAKERQCRAGLAIATEFTNQASEFETIARQAEAGVCIFKSSVDAISKKGGIN
jgi:hypothetical protein